MKRIFTKSTISWISIIFMIFGGLFMLSGEPMAGDSTILMPTATSVGIGCVFLLIGYLLFKKNK